jgi:hypothetical protein
MKGQVLFKGEEKCKKRVRSYKIFFSRTTRQEELKFT